MSITRCKAWCSVILGHVCRQKMVPWTRAMANLPVPQSIVPHLLGENPTRRSLGMTNLHQTALIVENLPATYLSCIVPTRMTNIDQHAVDPGTSLLCEAMWFR